MYLNKRPFGKSRKYGFIPALLVTLGGAQQVTCMQKNHKNINACALLKTFNQYELIKKPSPIKQLLQADKTGDWALAKQVLSKCVLGICSTDNKHSTKERISYLNSLIGTFLKRNTTLLHWACRLGDLQTAQSLVRLGANLEAQGWPLQRQPHYVEEWRVQRRPLYVASENGHDKIVALLLEMGAQINYTNTKASSPLHIASIKEHLGVIRALKEAHFDFEIKDEYGHTALHLACKMGKFKSADLLLALGANKNAREQNRRTPLFLACMENKPEIVKLLVMEHADPNIPDFLNERPLDYICRVGNFEIALILIEGNAPLTSGTLNEAPLHIACRNGHLKIVEELLAKGANPNTEGPDGAPLYIACLLNNLAMIKILVESGAKLSPKRYGETPLSIVCLKQQYAIAEYLVLRGAGEGVRFSSESDERKRDAPIDLLDSRPQRQTLQRLNTGAKISVLKKIPQSNTDKNTLPQEIIGQICSYFARPVV